ncbi:PIN domain-containing protein [Bradyrhizobium commune]|uniref:PIN domain-containing protein n=1 Tax=Bradyrhizobium commune TaxID=83627 RepID=UPI001FEE16B4|nr:PIN domain-containing protein [Bradyrhizobium commune]
MILLETNVVSEAMKPELHPSVGDWLDAQAAETVFLSSVSIAELLFGIGALPRGKRRDKLAAAGWAFLDGVAKSSVINRLSPFASPSRTATVGDPPRKSNRVGVTHLPGVIRSGQ